MHDNQTGLTACSVFLKLAVIKNKRRPLCNCIISIKMAWRRRFATGLLPVLISSRTGQEVIHTLLRNVPKKALCLLSVPLCFPALHPTPPISLYFSVSLSLSLSVFLCLSDSVSMSLCHCFCLTFSVSVSLCLCDCLCLCVTVSLCLFVCLCLYLSVSVSVCLSVCLSVSPSLNTPCFSFCPVTNPSSALS